jgi:cytochrome c peroxidase
MKFSVGRVFGFRNEHKLFGAALALVCVVLPSAAQADLFEPLKLPTGLDAKKVELGKRLFSETKLSKDGTLSCASCHDFTKGGADARAFSVGVGGTLGDMNSPTVFNAANNFKQFWDGRADDLIAQADGPVSNPAEMAADWPGVIARLQTEPSYVSSFKASYKDGITSLNIRDAIATFEQTLITTGSKFDRYLGGDKKALNALELAGFETFQKLQCDKCHNGPNMGGATFERFGVIGKPAFLKNAGETKKRDMGRFNITKSRADLHRFKVPSLRNITQTAPYFHNASAATLEEAVQIMAEVQLGVKTNAEQTAQLVAFLGTLTGDLPATVAASAKRGKVKR